MLTSLSAYSILTFYPDHKHLRVSFIINFLYHITAGRRNPNNIANRFPSTPQNTHVLLNQHPHLAKDFSQSTIQTPSYSTLA
ncbi:hypothetical protein CW304_12820 [Bacillus sp. UFRGS-B20]|nr:hypothetical protein CW304_12820 [Bacillus sp. UFRGS-B20]